MAQNHVLLETINLTQAASSVTFDNIPQTGYTDLKVVMSIRGAVGAVGDDLVFRFNGSTSGYTGRYVSSNGSSAASGTNGYGNFGGGYPAVANSATANTYSNIELYIPNYSGSQQKSFFIDIVGENNSTTSYNGLNAGLWSGTGSIASIYLQYASGNFMAGSTLSLYGIANSLTAPVVSPYADGGNIIANDGTYWYHAFLSSGTFTPKKALTCDYLVVAGGGGGGSHYHGAGGGAGGLRAIVSQAVTTGNYAVEVGAGGAGGIPGSGKAGANGTGSSFNSFATSGGGGGCSIRGDYAIDAGKNGGSGGGASSYAASYYGTGNTGGYSPVEGYTGGSASSSAPYYGSAGGGGAAAVGGNGTNSGGGAGGAGANTYNSINFSSWLSTTNTGASGYLAGGGGGSCYDAGAYGAGGTGGGGRGASQVSGYTFPVAGTANTGGGGGGAERSEAGIGASGGSGIIIIRYPMV